MMRRLHVICALLVVPLQPSIRFGQDQQSQQKVESPNSTLAPEVLDAFRWFDGRDFPRLDNRKFIRLFGGGWTNSEDDPPQAGHGFLLRANDKQFTVLMLDLSEHTFEAADHNGADEDHLSLAPIRFEVADLRAVAQECIAATRNPGRDLWLRMLGNRVPERVQLFLLARACHATGHQRLAKELIDQTVADDLHGPTSVKALRATIADDIGHEQMWQAIESFGNPKVSRKQLHDRFRRIIEQFPECRHVGRARDTAELLARMVQEDETHRRESKPFEEMAADEKVAELIFQLREQNGTQIFQPGRCDIFADPRDGGRSREQDAKPVSAAAQLVELGLDAVPQLIEALDDQRFTRSVGYHRHFCFSHHVLRVGDCALAIIERIACRRFYDGQTTSSEMLKEGKDNRPRKQVEAWWAEVQKKGEKQLLIETLSKVGFQSPAQARRLIKIAPDAAAAAIAAGTQACREEWIRTQLVNAAAELHTDQATALLENERDEAPYLNTRVEAALALVARGAKETTIAAMIREWKRTVEQSIPGGHWRHGQERLIALLIQSENPSAIKAIAADFGRSPVDGRVSIVSGLAEALDMYDVSHGFGTGLIPGNHREQTPEALNEIEALLVAALDDTETRRGMSGHLDAKTFRDPRVCDIAGHALATRWKGKYEFDLSADEAQRDIQRFRAINVWRKEQGLRPVEVPKRSHE